MELLPYTPELVPAVTAFNSRLRARGELHYRFPETHVPLFPKMPGTENHYQEGYVLVDDGHVRGAYYLLHQKFAINGDVQWIGSFQLPISEGIVNPSYNMVPVYMLRHALRQHTLMFCLGIGGFHERLARFLMAMGWTLESVPFYFKIINVSRFLANIIHLRRSNWTRFLTDALRYTGVGWVGTHLLQFRIGSRHANIHGSLVQEFGSWANTVWDKSKKLYSLVAVRDSELLNSLYADSKFLRLKVCRNQQTLGWAVMLNTKMSDHNYFGSMRVGSIVDCLAEPRDAPAVINSAVEVLVDKAVDLIVSNQTSSAWCAALEHNGFLKGPSNFILATSQDLRRSLEPFATRKRSIHMNRGDCDGPVNL